MEIANETNKVLDKLAEILGATGGEVVDAYTRGVFYDGMTNAVMCLMFAVMVVASIKIGAKSISLIGDRKQETKCFILGVIGGFGLIVSLFGFFFNLGLAITRLGAPRAGAIQKLIDQLSRF